MTETRVAWMGRVKTGLKKKDCDEAAEIALFMLEETGIRFHTLHTDPRIGDMKGILTVCRQADNALVSIMGSGDVSSDLKEIVESGRESLAIRFPFLPVEI